MDKKEREILYGQSDHVRKYGKDYKKRLSSVGLKVDKIKSNKFLEKDKISKYGIDEKEDLFLVTK